MKITEITVSAGRTFNNPHESYSNLRVDLELRAKVEEGDKIHAQIVILQQFAEASVEAEKQLRLRLLNEEAEKRWAKAEEERRQQNLGVTRQCVGTDYCYCNHTFGDHWPLNVENELVHVAHAVSFPCTEKDCKCKEFKLLPF